MEKSDVIFGKMIRAVYIEGISSFGDIICCCYNQQYPLNAVEFSLLFLTYTHLGLCTTEMNITMRGIDYLYDIDPHLRMQVLKGWKLHE